ncbi:MAG: biotin--[acetyl-CoA-carboxylase] ligase [Betaproteobacteria bacterium]|nr:biotin--[acetyl-CoA-carboxylase] ligase [Betaproteobacteria bacterium]
MPVEAPCCRQRTEDLLPAHWLIETLTEVDSTNSELMRRARRGETASTLLIAEQQTAGRGRLGRPWHSQRGQALMFSLGLEFNPMHWSGLSLAVGLSLLNSLDPHHQLGLGLKWPNDLWLGPVPQARKLGGILIETALLHGAKSARYVVIGVGINLQAPPAQMLSMPAAAWCDLQPQATVASTLQSLLLPLVDALDRFTQTGFAPLRTAYARRDLLAGQAIRLSNGVEGVAAGVDAQGVLQIDTAQGRMAVSSDEVSVRLGPAA